MADQENIIEIILQAKDLASEAVAKLQTSLNTIPDTTEKVGKSTSMLSDTWTSLKENWLATSAALVAAWYTVQKAWDWAELGAKVQQTEDSFKIVTAAYGEDGDKLLAKLTEVSAGTIAQTDLMQAAVKGLQQGLTGDQLVAILEVARAAAKTAGTDIATAFNDITNAIEANRVKALKPYLSALIDVDAAQKAYADNLGIDVKALDEHQKQQALFNAVIIEGQKQLKAYGDQGTTTSEQMQAMNAQIKTLKEAIGKELFSALSLVSENIDALVVALSAAAIVNAPAAFEAITVAMAKLAESSTAVSATSKAAFVGLASFIGYELGKAIDNVTYELTGIDLTGLNKPLEDAKKATSELSKNTVELNAKLAELGFTGPNAWKQYEAAVAAGNIVTDTATGKVTNLLDTIKQSIALMDAITKTLQATSDYEIELIKKDYETGKITIDQYVAFVQGRQKRKLQAGGNYALNLKCKRFRSNMSAVSGVLCSGP